MITDARSAIKDSLPGEHEQTLFGNGMLVNAEGAAFPALSLLALLRVNLQSSTMAIVVIEEGK